MFFMNECNYKVQAFCNSMENVADYKNCLKKNVCRCVQEFNISLVTEVGLGPVGG